jgi:SRSO17 transposase
MTPLPPLDPVLLNRLDSFVRPLLSVLTGARPRRLARQYVQGLLGPGERKTVAPIVQRVRGVASAPAQEAKTRAMLNDPGWSHRLLMSESTQRLLRAVPRWEALTLDDTALLKQGSHSVGVANQYAGCVGGLARSQVLVTVGLASEDRSAPIAARLFLSQAWCDDEVRRAACHVPLTVRYQSKWQIGLAMLDDARGDGVPAHPVLADSLYGDVTDFRKGLQQRGWPYVVACSTKTRAWPLGTVFAIPDAKTRGRRAHRLRPTRGERPLHLHELAESLPTQAWQTVRWRDGSRGPQTGRFAAVRVRVSHGWNGTGTPVDAMLAEEWLLMNWPLGEQTPTKAWLSNLPVDTPLVRLIGYARLRWRIERDYQESKSLLGLDHYEGRTWAGLHHHIALNVVAHQFLTVERSRESPEVPPLTLPAAVDVSTAFPPGAD